MNELNKFLTNLLASQYNLDPSDINILNIHENQVKIEINGEVEIHQLQVDYKGLAQSIDSDNMKSTVEIEN